MADPNERLMTTICMMDRVAAEHDGEAVVAFRAATRMLKAQGLNWSQVAERAFGPTQNSRPAPTPPTGGRGFTDIFDGMFNDFERGFNSKPQQSSPPPRDPPRPRRKERVTGADVPSEIVGTVVIVDADRAWRNGPMLVLDIEGENSVYGPLVCFAGSVQADLRAALAAGKPVMARVRPPRAEGQMPVVSTANPF